MADKISVLRYNFGLEIWDNKHKLDVANEGFNTDSLDKIINELEDVINELRIRHD